MRVAACSLVAESAPVGPRTAPGSALYQALRGLALDAPALEWLLTRTGRDLGSLVRVLDRLDRESLAAKRRLTVPFLRGVLGDHDSP